MFNSGNILVKFRQEDGDFLALTTYSRTLGKRGRFLMFCKKLREWYRPHHEGDTFMDTDCGNVLMICNSGKTMNFRILWLNHYGENCISGNEQRFTLSEWEFAQLIYTDLEIARLIKPESRVSPIRMHYHLTPILSDKLVRRAFCKAVRDGFKWGEDSQITLYPDGGKNFMFEERRNGNRSIIGGLILHENTRKHPGVIYKQLTYSVHT